MTNFLPYPQRQLGSKMRIYVDSLALTNTTISAGTNGASNTTATKLNLLIQSLTIAKKFY
mgnify:CR=1 FL=1